MNERIREFAEQAGLKYYNWITNESNVNDGDFTYPRLEDYEKFAELIVQECISICKEKERANLYGVREVEATIKEHFGVEE